MCHFRRYDPPGVDPSTLPTVDKVLALEPPAACFTADALTVMRKAQATLSGLRVVLAGKIRGDVGWMPGILEEVDATLEAGKPVLVLGGLGGCAGLIAGFLGGGEWPEAFSVDEALKAPAFARMFAHRSNEVSLRARYQDVKTRLEALREAKKGEPIHGVPHHLFVRALTETSPREVLRLVSDVAAKVA